MIRYALKCEHDHRFDAWFGSSSDFDDQAQRGLVECPYCGSRLVSKAPMAPAVRGTKRSPSAETTAVNAAKLAELASKVRDHVAETHDYVGESFAEEARAMHYGEKPHAPIYGETTPDEAKALKDEGVPAAPLPPAFAPQPPKKVN
ncbi:MAG: DUF1178 family protein [Maricaulaceae bacterium]